RRVMLAMENMVITGMMNSSGYCLNLFAMYGINKIVANDWSANVMIKKITNLRTMIVSFVKRRPSVFSERYTAPCIMNKASAVSAVMMAYGLNRLEKCPVKS